MTNDHVDSFKFDSIQQAKYPTGFRLATGKRKRLVFNAENHVAHYRSMARCKARDSRRSLVNSGGSYLRNIEPTAAAHDYCDFRWGY